MSDYATTSMAGGLSDEWRAELSRKLQDRIDQELFRPLTPEEELTQERDQALRKLLLMERDRDRAENRALTAEHILDGVKGRLGHLHDELEDAQAEVERLRSILTRLMGAPRFEVAIQLVADGMLPDDALDASRRLT